MLGKNEIVFTLIFDGYTKWPSKDKMPYNIDDIKAVYETTADKVRLPTTVLLNLNDGTTKDLTVETNLTGAEALVILAKDAARLVNDATEFNAINAKVKVDENIVKDARIAFDANIVLNETNLLKTYKSSDYFKSEYIEMEVINNEKITVKGQCSLDKTGFMFEIVGTNGFLIQPKWKAVNKDGTFNETFSFDGILKDGDYKINVYFITNGEAFYQGCYYGIPFKVQE